MARLHPIEERIVGRLRRFPKKASERKYSDRQWTIGIKIELGELGKREGFKVCAAGLISRGYEEEWLYDLVWYRYHSRTKYVQEIKLIAESEWSWKFSDIKDDFEKLMVGRSAYRLMIFQASNRKSLDDYADRLIRSILRFRGTETGDRYLFAGWDDTAEEFVFRSFVA